MPTLWLLLRLPKTFPLMWLSSVYLNIASMTMINVLDVCVHLNSHAGSFRLGTDHMWSRLIQQ
jgi:hypothetical protein